MFRIGAFAATGVALLLALGGCRPSSVAGAPSEEAPLDGRVIIGQRFAASHSAVFDAAEKALGAQGFTIAERRRPGSAGMLTTMPRYAWTGCLKDEIERTAQHPGVVILVETGRKADSTAVNVNARSVRAVPDVVVEGDTMNVALPLQLCSMVMLMAAIDSLVGQ